MIERKAYRDLLAWKAKSRGRTALLIEGVRRVGKTTLVEEFSKREYRSSIVIDFSKAGSRVRSLFDDFALDFDSLFFYLSHEYGTPLYERESLIVFDEVQRYPRAREMIKHLVADARYDYIETGSLLSIRENVENIVIPSEEMTYQLNPLDFEEFLRAVGEGESADLIRHEYDALHAMPPSLHRKMLRLWREYLLIGGMPAVVDSWARTHALEEPEEEKQGILELYRNDIGKFAGSAKRRVARVFDNLPGQLSKHEKRFVLSSVGPNARHAQYEGSFFWLDEARVINPCYRCADPEVDLRMAIDDAMVKCYVVDTGLLFSMAFPSGRNRIEAQDDVLRGRININEGMLAENAVAQALRARGEELLFYSNYDAKDAGRRMEIDFLVVRPYSDAGGKMRVTPIEVKSGTHFSTKSLDKFRDVFGKRVGSEIVLSPKGLSVEGRRLYLPLYMAHLV